MSEQTARELADDLDRRMAGAEADRTRYLSDLADTAATVRAASPGVLAAGAEPEEPAMTVLGSKDVPEAQRVEVLQQLSGNISRRPEYIELLLSIVQDQSDGAAIREAALRTLNSAAFQVARFEPHQLAYEAALLNLATDPVARLREMAVSALAHEHNPQVQQILLDGLEGRRDPVVPRKLATQLLAEDDHLNNLAHIQRLYQDGSEDERHEAVRLMGAYTGARDTLAGILQNRSETSLVRRQSAASLRNLDPDGFEDIAKGIATDASEDPEVRTACLQTLQYLGNADRVYGDSNFVSRVEATGREDSPVSEAARQMLQQRPNP